MPRQTAAPIQMTDIALTYPVQYGKGVRCSVANADRPWCAAMAAIHSTLAARKQGLAVGGKIGQRYVRDLPGWTDVAMAVRDRMIALDPVQNIRLSRWASALQGLGMGNRVIPLAVMGKALDDYQLSAVRWMPVSGGVIGDSVGLGKTLTALASAACLMSDVNQSWASPVCNQPMVLVVCPLNAMPVWKDPAVAAWLRSFIPALSSYEVISADSLHKYESMSIKGPSVLIVDEGHYFGMWSAERTKLIHKIRFQFDACIVLTASMLHAGPDKVLSLLDLACPGAALFSNKYEFGSAFECIVNKKIGTVTKKEVGRPGLKHMESFQKYLSRFVMARNKRSPEVMHSVMIPDQEIYTVKTGDCSQPVVDECAEMALTIYQETKVLPSMQEVVHRLARVGIEDKLNWLDDMMHDNDEPVVMFGTYHGSLNATEEWLRGCGIDYVRIDGGVTGDKRSLALSEFQSGKARVVLAQTDAASVSMNLQRARISVMLDTGQKSAAFEQALGRTCRRGSTELCHHFNLAGNHFQAFVYNRLEAGMDFNAQVAVWQDAKRKLDSLTTPPQGAIP